MRLRTCVALELVTGVFAAVGVLFSVTWGFDEARVYWQGEARAAEVASARTVGMAAAAHPDIQTSRQAVSRGAEQPPGSDSRPGDQRRSADDILAIELDLSAQTGAAPNSPGNAGPDDELQFDPEILTAAPAGGKESWRDAPYYGVFDGFRDELLIAPLRDSAIKRVRFNRGGSSISLRIDFENGATAAFKPQQIAPQTVPRKEIAAYRINRLLGLNSVPPAIGRKFNVRDLLDSVARSSQSYLPRLREEMRTYKDTIAGELSWWIPIIKNAQIRGYDIDTTDGIVTWKRYLTIGHEIPDDEAGMLEQISSMVLFDFIINNPDRWSGANARVSEDNRILYFMDNTLSFGNDPNGHRKCRTYLLRAQKFSRSLVATARALGEDAVRDALSRDLGPYSYLLTDKEIKALMSRRDVALSYIDELIDEHGENTVLVFP
ncbi:MAG: hypothetical protein MJE77_13200 [Proteobacteria bacterium]|nr:hypothetical protein [Pseudomonadota bacterium]